MILRRLGVVLVATVVALAAGCGGGNGPTKQVKKGPSARAVKWAGEICAALDEWATTVVQKLSDAQAYDPATGPAGAYGALIAAAQGGADATNAAVEAVDAAGEPPVDDGVVVAVGLVDALRHAQTAFGTAQASLQALSPNEPAALINGAEGARAALAAELAQIRSELASAFAVSSASKLSPAFAAAPACDGLLV